MAKIISDKELLAITSAAVHGDTIDDVDQYREFVRDLAGVVTKHFGGTPSEHVDYMDDDIGYTIAIHLDENVPPDGGVFSPYDSDITWKDGVETETKIKTKNT